MAAGAGLAVAPASRDLALDASLAALASAKLEHADHFHTYTGALVVFPA